MTDTEISRLLQELLEEALTERESLRWRVRELELELSASKVSTDQRPARALAVGC